MRSFLLPLLATGALAAEFPAPFNTEPGTTTPMPAEQAAASMKVPPGFHVSLFAGEPDVQQPIAMATDSRGRLWVAECYTYAESKVGFEPKQRDRIVIFEDTDNDGRFDKRTVFWDEGQRLTSIELGFGGVWATCAPNLLFIPDKNGDDIPDGPAEVVLDGWNSTNVRHNIVNGLRWGPDGWLYGRHGILATSRVGAPGTPDDNRTPINCGIWRYHPIQKVFEVVASGTTNPWGMDWNEAGEAFFTNTVIGHLWHLIPGAHYQRMYGEDLNPNTYELMPMCADHWHFDTGAGWTKSRAALDAAATVAPTSDALGGGHAHCGCLIYKGDQWPAGYRGKLLTINFHGRRLNMERLEHSGSGYVAKHEPDFLQSADPWFRGIDLIQAPDGGVFLADWSDSGECHNNQGINRTSGRIFKITYGQPKLPEPLAKIGDLSKLPTADLIKAVELSDDWSARMARRLIQERMPTDTEAKELKEQMWAAFEEELAGKVPENVKQRRWDLWNAIGSNSRFRGLFGTRFQMGAYEGGRFASGWTEADLSRRNRSLWFLGYDTRFYSAFQDLQFSTLRDRQWLPEQQRFLLSYSLRTDSGTGEMIIRDVIRRPDFGSDRTVLLLAWYAIEHQITKGGGDPEFTHFIARFGNSDQLVRWTVRRLFSELDKSPKTADLFLRRSEMLLPVPPSKPLKLDGGPVNGSGSDFIDPPEKLPQIIARAQSILDGIADALQGRRQAPKPESWDAFAKRAASTPELAPRVRNLNVIFGDPHALDEIHTMALDEAFDPAVRRAALQSLIDARAPELRDTCEKLLGTNGLGVAAARGLAVFDDPKIGASLLAKYSSFQSGERSDIIGILASRPTWAGALLEAIATGSIERGNVSAFHARQIRSFNNATLTKRLAEVWGEIRDTDNAKRELIVKLKLQLTPEALHQAEPRAGRALFTQTCAVCHRLYGEGAEFGPDLTGSGRHDLSYLLENIADPSAIVPADFRLNIVTLKDGRVLSGVLGTKTERTVAVRSAGGAEIVERGDIAKLEELSQSPMPEGLLLALSETQVRDLIAYLMTDAQVPLPETK